jgi:hypothetical protein
MKPGKKKAIGKKIVKKKRPSKYDAAWKNFIKKHFEDFLEFFSPIFTMTSIFPGNPNSWTKN